MDAREPIVAESDSGRYRGTEGYGAIGSGRLPAPTGVFPIQLRDPHSLRAEQVEHAHPAGMF